jgi:adenine-specific DNA-methyltransferase
LKLKASESAQKLRGSYYTPLPVARFLARFALAGGARSALEPSCGEGVFFRALREQAPGRELVLTGCEIDAPAAAEARAHGARVLEADFLEWALAEPGERFDAAVGNPPFIRYQYLDAGQQQRAERIFQRAGLRFTRHTNAWVSFAVAALELLAPGGRLALVVPAELLHVLHAQALRDLLVRECARVLLVDAEPLLFEGALQGVLLLLAHKRASSAAPGCRIGIVPAHDRGVLERDPEALFAAAATRDAAGLRGKWMRALLRPAEAELFDELAARPEVARFGDVAAVDVGVVTGANHFFLVDGATVERFGLAPFVRPMFGRSEQVSGVVYREGDHTAQLARGGRVHFVDLRCAGELPAGARDYVLQGEQQGLHTRFKCRIRSPWYGVPSLWTAPVGLLKRSHDLPRLVLNRAGALTTDTCYRVRPRPGLDEALVGGFVSSLTALGAELEGRHYAGGVLELVPSEIERLPVIAAPAAAGRLAELDAAFRAGEPAEAILARQDAAVLGLAGATPAEQEALRAAWDHLRRRRQRRAPQRGAEEPATGVPEAGAASAA